MEKEISTCGAVIFDDNNNVLLVEHLPGAHNLTGKFGLPAGHVEDGEASSEAVVRELFEETGIKLNKGTFKRLPTVYHADIEQKDGVQHMLWEVFTAQVENCALRESEETRPMWVRLEEARDLNLLPNVLEAIREAELLRV